MRIQNNGEKGEMSALRRFRILIFVAVAVLLSVTIFSVTFCKWENPNKTAAVSGKVGTYYVDYDKSATDEKTVRQVSASTSLQSGSNVYENYVCVKRTVTDNESTFAYINFYAEGEDLSANVLEFTVTRTDVDANGYPTGSASSDVSVYNDPTGKTLADISPVDGIDDYSGRPCKIGGAYIMLYFGKEDKQFKALHITIKTDTPASFTLRAEASNKDKETVYQKGFGKPTTFYLGWEYESVTFFDPSAASEMTGTCSMDGEDIRGASVDKSLTVALNYGASIKAYRLSTGEVENGVERLPKIDDHRTRYFIPKNVVFDTSKLDCAYGTGELDQTNIIIKAKDEKLHQYKIRIVGTVSDSTATVDLQLNGVNKKTWGLTSDTQDRYIDTMYISIVDPAPEGQVWVHFDTNGGAAIEDVAAEKGKSYTPPTPTRAGYKFDGWYTDKALNTAFGTSAVVNSEITLYAKWNKLFTVTFNSNSGSAVDPQSVVSGSTATKPTDPSRTGFKFGGWYSDSALTEAYDFATPVTGSITLYAKWTADSTIITGDVDNTTYYLVGSGAFAAKYGITSNNWSKGIKPTSTVSNTYKYEKIYFELGDEFKFRTGDDWKDVNIGDVKVGGSTISDKGLYVYENNTNYHINKTGWYTLTLDSSFKLSVECLSANTSDTQSQYFIVGTIADNSTVDGTTYGIPITEKSGSEYRFLKVHLTAGDKIGFRSNSSALTASEKNTSYFTVNGNMLIVKTTGYYNFYFQPSNGNALYVTYSASI